MCTGIIGQCQCVPCMGVPNTGKFLRIEFCPAQQNALAWVCDPSSPRPEKLIPCANLTFNRIRDPNSCHFKQKDDTEMDCETRTAGADTDTKMTEPESTQKDEAVKDTANHTDNNTPISATATHSDIRFTPINATAVAQRGLAAMARKESNAAEDKATAGDDNIMADKTDKEDKAKKTDKDKVMDETRTKATAADDKMDIDTDTPSTTTATSAGPIPGQETPSKLAEQTDKLNINSITNTSPSQLTPSKRKRLPDSRPQTPGLLETTTAAAASGKDSKAVGNPWTHVETVKMLLLRSKGVGFDSERSRQFLPGRNAAECMDRLTGLAVKHGYEEYI